MLALRIEQKNENIIIHVLTQIKKTSIHLYLCTKPWLYSDRNISTIPEATRLVSQADEQFIKP